MPKVRGIRSSVLRHSRSYRTLIHLHNSRQEPVPLPYFDQQTFAPHSPHASADKKVTKGPFTGDFDRFVLRLRTTLDRERLSFLFKPEKDPGQLYKTEDMKELNARIVGMARRRGT